MNKEIITWTHMFKSLWHFLEGERLKFSFYMSLNFLSHSNTLIIPYIIGLIINFFTEYNKGDSLNLFYIYTGIILFSGLLTSQVRMVAKRKLKEIGVNTTFKARNFAFEKLLNFSLKWHEKDGSGSKLQKVNNGSSSYRQLINVFNQDALGLILTFSGVIIIFLFLDLYFLLFFIVYVGVFILIMKSFLKKQADIEEEKNKVLEKVSGSLNEGANNILSIKSSGSSQSLKSSMKKGEITFKEVQFRAIKIGNTRTKHVNYLIAFGLFFFLLLLGHFVSNELVEVGFIATSFVYFNQITASFWRSNSILNDLISIRSAMNRIIPIFETKEEKYFGEEEFKKDWKTISFNNVSFSYDNKKNNLDNISFKIKKHEKIGIVGHSGSGKSTLSKLFLGLYQINEGEIKVDHTNYYDFSHQSLLDNLSQVMQETEMLNVTLKENITMFKEIDSKTLRKAIEISQLNEVIKELPNGLDTIIGEKGYKLSGGQRQRVGIARAICKNSEILILDEATSALDSKTEMKIQKGIDLIKNKTILIIAHRLSTLKNVDRIFVFEQGKIIEQGNYKELIKDKKSKFYNMLNMQK